MEIHARCNKITFDLYKKKNPLVLKTSRLMEIDWPGGIWIVENFINYFGDCLTENKRPVHYDLLWSAFGKYKEAIDLKDSLRVYVFISVLLEGTSKVYSNMEITCATSGNSWNVLNSQPFTAWIAQQHQLTPNPEFHLNSKRLDEKLVMKYLKKIFLSQALIDLVDDTEKR